MKPIRNCAFVLAFSLTSCGTPPEYFLVDSGRAVTVNGRSCQADQYSVRYDRLFDIGQQESAITRDQGTQFRVNCGATTANCKLNESLEDCVAGLERPSSDSSSYSPPTY